MAKHSFELKRKIVMEYLSGHGSAMSLAKKYGVGCSCIKKWIKNYRQYGEESLLRSREKQTYPFEFKHHVVISLITLHKTSSMCNLNYCILVIIVIGIG